MAAKSRSKPKQSNKIKRAAPRQRMAESPLSRLKRSLSIYEHTAADEIVAAHHLAAGLPAPRDPDLGIPAPELRPDAADDMAARRVDLIEKFARWKRDLAGTPYLAVATSVLIHEHTMRPLERMFGWRNGAAKPHLLVALRHFAALRGNTPRGVRNWKFC